MISDENLRQIVEKTILGKINYKFSIPKEPLIFKAGNSVPILEFYDLKRHITTNLTKCRKQYLILNFFASFCTPCKAGKRIRTLQDLNNALKWKGWDLEIMIVFQKPFDQNDVAEILRKMDIPFNLFLGDNILPEDQDYITDNNYKNDPLLVVVRNGDIVFVEAMGADEREIVDNIINIAK